jgi:ABC-type enterochelin transport system substrate-binding protein
MIKLFFISFILLLQSCNSTKSLSESQKSQVANKTAEKKRRTIENKDMKSLPVKTKSVNK